MLDGLWGWCTLVAVLVALSIFSVGSRLLQAPEQLLASLLRC
jgi:hypothetical protein